MRTVSKVASTVSGKKYVVYVTYGVYVDTDTDDYNEEAIIAEAVVKMFSHGQQEVIGSCDAEIEDVTDEFREVESM